MRLEKIAEDFYNFGRRGIMYKEIAPLLEYKSSDVVKTSRLRCLEKLRQLYKQ